MWDVKHPKHMLKRQPSPANLSLLPSTDRKTYPNTPLSEFKVVDVYVRTHGLDDLVDDETEGKDEEVWKLPSSQRLTLYRIQ